MPTEADMRDKRAMASWRDLAALLIAYMRLNLAAQFEYRAAFASQVIGMFINDGVWVAFWGIFFARFPVLRGWDVRDVITVWAITAAGFGLAFALFGNGWNLAQLIAQGQLDAWMLYPRPVLPHLLVGQMSATAWGDALFGYVAYIIFVRPDPLHLLMFVGLTWSVALLFVGFSVFVGSLSFYVGNAVAIANQWRSAMITFSTYPAILFDGAAKLILFTLIPAGFVSFLPIEALHQLSLLHAFLALLGALAALAIGVVVFYVGLRRYESGNLMEMRG
jgi:ABC-2 type transport system permease protein